jgi:GPI-anchor transamidase subunit S
MSTTSEQHHRVAHYSPRYRLSFTLLNEDAAAGNSAAGWDIQEAIFRSPMLTKYEPEIILMLLTGHIIPYTTQLSILHNFTIESQVQYHAPLAFKPLALDGGFGITPEDLQVFINSAEWTLCNYFNTLALSCCDDFIRSV